MKKKKLVLKKKLKLGEKAPDAEAPVAALEVHTTTPIPSGPVKFKKSEVKIEKPKTDNGSDEAAAAAAKLDREREEIALSERGRRDAGGAGGAGGSSFWDDLPSW